MIDRTPVCIGGWIGENHPDKPWVGCWFVPARPASAKLPEHLVLDNVAAIALRMGRSIISRTSLTPTMHDRIEPNPGRKPPPHFRVSAAQFEEDDMTFGKGALLWLIGIPLPIILLLALFWR